VEEAELVAIVAYLEAKLQHQDMALAALAGKYYYMQHMFGFLTREQFLDGIREFSEEFQLDVDVVDMADADHLTPEMFEEPADDGS